MARRGWLFMVLFAAILAGLAWWAEEQFRKPDFKDRAYEGTTAPGTGGVTYRSASPTDGGSDIALEKGMVQVIGGLFAMGCTSSDVQCQPNEKPRHNVTLNKFYIDAHEVTQTEYAKVKGANPSAFNKCPDCPVEQVTWYEALDYCHKVGKRLPTEAEWEMAARGARDEEIRYGEKDAISWNSDNSGSATHPVGKKAANRLGLYDTMGNVWEWCNDWYGEHFFTSGDSINPKGPQAGISRVIRGGSWAFFPGGIRTSVRSGLAPSTRSNTVGFRCALD